MEVNIKHFISSVLFFIKDLIKYDNCIKICFMMTQLGSSSFVYMMNIFFYKHIQFRPFQDYIVVSTDTLT